MKLKWQQAGFDFLFVLPGFLGVCVFVLIPSLDVVRRSFLDAVGSQFRGFENYQTVMDNMAFRQAFKNTVRFIAVCIPILLILSLAAALLLKGVKKGRQACKSAYLLPLAVPVASVAFIWKLLFHKQGMVNGLFANGGYDWMGTELSFYILVVSYIWKNLGYHIVLWLAGLDRIPATLYEAASMDGAGVFAKLFYITLPALKRMGYTVAVLALLNSFKVFREAYLVAGDYPHERMYLLQHLFQNWFREMDFEKLSAGAVLMVLLLTIFVFLLNRSWEEQENRPGQNRRQRRAGNGK